MHILMVHNHYQLRGGEDESYQSEVRVLREAGHHVVAYTEHNDRVKVLGNVRTAIRTVWAAESYQRLRDILSTSKPDLLHVQNFFPLISPSVYYAARTVGLPVIQTLRNYRLVCPNALLFRDGQVCEECIGKTLTWPGVQHACYRHSRGATATVAAMIATHRLASTWTEMVDLYVALTDFARGKFIEGGLPAEKIVVKPNFVHPDPGEGEHGGGYALFVGRLSSEKGTSTLLKAWQRLGGSVPLRIVGDGPLREQVQLAAETTPGVEYLGRRSVDEVYALMADARVLIVPSEWYETFGRVAVEAFAKGTPVIATNIGAIAELIDHGRTGLLFTPGSAESLIEAVEWAWLHTHELACMGQEARREYEAKYTASCNYRILMEIYERVIKQVPNGR
jgi:glycosyltransferase involved in cell wall biosynthesis